MPCLRRGRSPIVSPSFHSAFFETYAEYRQELARCLCVELRIGSQKLEELRHRPWELRPLLGRFHLCLDARHLLQANLVDLLCRQIQRRELLDHGLVVGLAIRHRGCRERRASLRHVLGAHESEEPLVCRCDDLTEHRLRFGAHRVLVRLGDTRGHLRERREQRIGAVRLEVRLDRLITPNDRHARHRKTPRQAGSHTGDLLVEVARHVAKTA